MACAVGRIRVVLRSAASTKAPRSPVATAAIMKCVLVSSYEGMSRCRPPTRMPPKFQAQVGEHDSYRMLDLAQQPACQVD